MLDEDIVYFKLKGEVTLIHIGDNGALLDVEKRCCYELNNTALHILTSLAKGSRYQKVQAELISTFDVNQQTAERDVRNFVSDLLRLGIIDIVEVTTTYSDTTKATKGAKIYEPPAIEYKSELAVACAPTEPT